MAKHDSVKPLPGGALAKAQADILSAANLDLGQFVKEKTGYPPYWQPAENQGFCGTVLRLDDKDPEFCRFVIRAAADILCYQGPTDNADEVLVHQGEEFSCSVYAVLPLEKYFGCQVLVVCKGKRKLAAAGKTLWEFDLFVAKESKKALHAGGGSEVQGKPTPRALKPSMLDKDFE
jgi:hypothetical protein